MKSIVSIKEGRPAAVYSKPHWSFHKSPCYEKDIALEIYEIWKKILVQVQNDSL